MFERYINKEVYNHYNLLEFKDEETNKCYKESIKNELNRIRNMLINNEDDSNREKINFENQSLINDTNYKLININNGKPAGSRKGNKIDKVYNPISKKNNNIAGMLREYRIFLKNLDMEVEKRISWEKCTGTQTIKLEDVMDYFKKSISITMELIK